MVLGTEKQPVGVDYIGTCGYDMRYLIVRVGQLALHENMW